MQQNLVFIVSADGLEPSPSADTMKTKVLGHGISNALQLKERKKSNALQWRHNGATASQITSLTIVYSTVYSDADQMKHQSSASLAFVGHVIVIAMQLTIYGIISYVVIDGDRWIPCTNGQ